MTKGNMVQLPVLIIAAPLLKYQDFSSKHCLTSKKIKTLPCVPQHLLRESGPNLPQLHTNANHSKHQIVYITEYVTERLASTKYSC